MHKVKNFIKVSVKIFITFFGLIKLIIYVLLNKIKRKKSCILISNGFSLSGAPVVLFEVAKIYKEEGFDVYIFSKHMGKLIKMCREIGVKYTVIPFGEKIAQLIYSCIDAEFYFVNTIVNYKWIDWLEKKNINTYWWIHEGTTYIEPCSKNVQKIKIRDNIKVYAVSEWSVSELEKNNISLNPQLLYYGCNDMFENGNKKVVNNMFNILLIGNICSRKNQLYFLEQYSKLNKDEKNRIKVTIIGSKLNGEEDYYKKFLSIIKKENNITHYEVIDREKIKEFYLNANLFVCTSIDDPLPVVVTESLMYEVPILISDNSGQFSLIKEGKNGFVYSNHNENELSIRLSEILKIEDSKLIQIGKEGRKIYKKYFDLSNFSKKIKDITLCN